MTAPSPAAGSRSFALGESARGRRVDELLAQWLLVSRAEARRLLAQGTVRLDGRCLALADKGRPLPGHGELRVEGFVPPSARRPLPPLPDDREPVWLASGPGWLALDKPAGMPVHPLRPDERGSALAHAIGRRPRILGVGEGGLRSGVVHRLDVETSGALLFGSDEASWQRLRAAFSEHRVEKTYRALVVGEFETPAGEAGRAIEQEFFLRVARHRPARVRVVAPGKARDPGVRRVRQSVRVLERFAGASLLEIRPRTGFLHQIRSTLAHLGHPLLGDRIYCASRPEAVGGRAETASGRPAPEGVPPRDQGRRRLWRGGGGRCSGVGGASPGAAGGSDCLARLGASRRERGVPE